jgi:hypothetical protein
VVKRFSILSVFICACFAGLWPNSFVFADSGLSTPAAGDNVFDAAAKSLEKAKEETQRLKDSWDKTRLEATLYDKRAKRAYTRWVKATKKVKQQANLQKGKAELEFQLAIEKRKLAWSEWQAAQYRLASHEALIRELDQKKDTVAIKAKIKEIEKKLNSPLTDEPSPAKE